MNDSLSRDEAIELYLPVIEIQRKYGGQKGLAERAGLTRQNLYKLAMIRFMEREQAAEHGEKSA